MESKKSQQWHQFYGKYLPKVQELSSLRSHRSVRVNSIDQLFQNMKQKSEEIQYDDTIRPVVRKVSIKKLEPVFKVEEMHPKKRSISLTLKKFQKHVEEDSLSKRKSQNDLLKEMADKIDQRIHKQSLQLKKLELHKVHVNQVLNQLVNSNEFKDIREVKFITSRESKKYRRSPLTLDKKGGLLDPLKYEDLYQKIEKSRKINIKMPEGPLLSFRQFAKQQGMRLPKFLE